MVVNEANINNIMGGIENTGSVRLHNHKRKLKQRFDIIKKLGQGTYGKVQLGINKETGQEVAIKTIKKCKIDTEADLIRIRREIQIMSSVQHPNIIHIYEVFENKEKMVLVMEYAAGGELYDYLSKRKILPEQEARRIFRQISTAVFYCHKHKICHRDLKLENILLDQAGNAKIADFGLSNVFDDQRLLNTFCGSPLYASPEIVKGTPYHGPEVDCWSLGVLLYTLVYGAMPFDGSNFKRLVKQISQSDYFEPKKSSSASSLIRDMLTVTATRRATIEKICSHWWVNEDYEQNCLDVAEKLAAQTPVRLDLLLSLVPKQASAEKLVIDNQNSESPSSVQTKISSAPLKSLIPTRCRSVDSLMEVDQNTDSEIKNSSTDKLKTHALKALPITNIDGKRKLESTTTTENEVLVDAKKKECGKRRDGSVNLKGYRSISKHHSAPIPSSILEEPMETDCSSDLKLHTSKTTDLIKMKKTNVLDVKKKPNDETIEKDKINKVCNETKSTNNQIEIKVDCHLNSHKKLNKYKSESIVHKSEPMASVNDTLITEAKTDNFKPSEQKNVDLQNKCKIISNNLTLRKDFKSTDSLVKSQKDVKKVKNRTLSLDSELPAKKLPLSSSTERRKSKIFETAEKFSKLVSPIEPEKPKKIFIPGVDVSGTKLAFEKKANLSSSAIPQAVKTPVSKTTSNVDFPNKDFEIQKSNKIEKEKKLVDLEEEKKRAVDIITGALGKPPVQKKRNGSPPISFSNDSQKASYILNLNELKNSLVASHLDNNLQNEIPNLSIEPIKPNKKKSSHTIPNSTTPESKMCSKIEITLKSATLPRSRKTSKAEISISDTRSQDAKHHSDLPIRVINPLKPRALFSQKSEIAFPTVAVTSQRHRSSSLDFKSQSDQRSFNERIIPIHVETLPQQATVHSTTPPPKLPQRSSSQRSCSLSRQSTVESDTDSTLGSTFGAETIRKSPREYIIPISVEGDGYVIQTSSKIKPENRNSTSSHIHLSKPEINRSKKLESILSESRNDETAFSLIHRDDDGDGLQRHMHRLRSSRPSRQTSDYPDSLSSGDDDDDDGFELLTAENLFSTLLSRVRSLTQRLNVDVDRTNNFPSSRLLNEIGTNSYHNFWGTHKPVSTYQNKSMRSQQVKDSEESTCKHNARSYAK